MQRAFGVRRSGKPKQIWEFTPAGTELKLIKKTAAEDGFYSEPAPVGASTLDEQITDLETPLSRRLAALRTLPAGTIADPATAADLVSHLAPRTSHLRSVFTKGMTGLLDGAIEVFGDADNVKRLFGFDGDGPSDLLTDLLRPTLKKDPRFALFVQLGLPEPVLEQMAFRIGKEHFDSTFGAGFGDIAAGLSRVRAQAEGQAKLAEALNSFSPGAAQLSITPQFLQALVGVLGFDLTVYTYVQQTIKSISIFDIVSSMVKAVVFAVLIAGIGCQRGGSTAWCDRSRAERGCGAGCEQPGFDGFR